MMNEKQQVKKRRKEKCDDCFGVRKGVETLQHREEREKIYEVLFHTRELAASWCRAGGGSAATAKGEHHRCTLCKMSPGI